MQSARVKKRAEASTRAYHVCKLSHAQTVGLDALVGQDVVHQHQFTVVEPDLHALGLLWWGSVGPFWKARNRHSRDDRMRPQTGRWHSPNFSFQAWNSISSRERLAQLATARRAAATNSDFILTDNGWRRGRQVRDDMQEAAGGFSLAFMALSEPFFLFSVLLQYKNRKCARLCLHTLSVYLTCLVCVCAGDTGWPHKAILLYAASVMTCSVPSQVTVSSLF